MFNLMYFILSMYLFYQFSTHRLLASVCIQSRMWLLHQIECDCECEYQFHTWNRTFFCTEFQKCAFEFFQFKEEKKSLKLHASIFDLDECHLYVCGRLDKRLKLNWCKHFQCYCLIPKCTYQHRRSHKYTNSHTKYILFNIFPPMRKISLLKPHFRRRCQIILDKLSKQQFYLKRIHFKIKRK